MLPRYLSRKRAQVQLGGDSQDAPGSPCTVRIPPSPPAQSGSPLVPLQSGCPQVPLHSQDPPWSPAQSGSSRVPRTVRMPPGPPVQSGCPWVPQDSPDDPIPGSSLLPFLAWPQVPTSLAHPLPQGEAPAWSWVAPDPLLDNLHSPPRGMRAAPSECHPRGMRAAPF